MGPRNGDETILFFWGLIKNISFLVVGIRGHTLALVKICKGVSQLFSTGLQQQQVHDLF